MHPFHEYIARQVAEKLKARRVVVWYDPRREFEPFIKELRGGQDSAKDPVGIVLGESRATLVEFAGSFLAVRAAAEPLFARDTPDPLLLYVPGVERDRRGSLLMELELAGTCYEPQLKRLARNALRQKFTDGLIDDLLGPETVTYGEIVRALEGDAGPSLLKVVFGGSLGNDAILAAWLASDARDADIESHSARPELVKLVHARLGLQLPGDEPLPKLRAITARYVLAGDFRLDLRCPPPPSVASVPAPGTKAEEEAVRAMAKLLRASHGDAYMVLASTVEHALGLKAAMVPSGALGAIDTFRFEERALLSYCGELIVAGRWDEALAIVSEREGSFWLERDVVRKAHWEACRRMALLGKEAMSVRQALPKLGSDPARWVEAYTTTNGWHQLDLLQRRMEALLTGLEEEPEERPLGLVRRAYEDAQQAMAQGFTRVLRQAGWTVPGTLHQTRIFAEIVSSQPKPVAYFLVDAMRFEMGTELAGRLPGGVDVSLRPAVAALPSITPVGMAALMPEASGSFSVAEEGGKLGVKIGGAFLPDLAARKRFAAARVPNLVDVTLDDLLSLTASKVKKKVEDAQVVIVRSQEIDQAGESGHSFQARQVMDTVIDNLVRAIRKLAAAGVVRSVVTADHGHVFFAAGRDEAMRTGSPGGATVELHRRCWIGRGGTTPSGTVRVPASALGYDSTLEFVFPEGGGVFKAGGDLAFHHGGPSLQELIVPVLNIKMPGAAVQPATSAAVQVSSVPIEITNRMISVHAQSLLEAHLVPVLISEGRRVGGLFGAINAAAFDRDAGTVTLKPDVPTVLALRLTDDTVKEVRLVFLDPATDAELYRSPGPIPLNLGV